MEIKERRLKGVYEITLKPYVDERGFFMRTFDDKIFEKAGININWVQENHSKSIKKGTIRGIHFQSPPFTDAKMIRVISGKIWDVFVDLRKDSSTFGQWDYVEIDSEKMNAVFIPRGLAHGFCSLRDNTEMIYHHDNYYNSKFDTGIIWNDIDLGIKWPFKKPVIISDRDKTHQTFKTFIEKYGGL